MMNQPELLPSPTPVVVMRTCPPVQDLEQLLEDGLEPTLQNALEDHVGSCAPCQEALLMLAANREEWEPWERLLQSEARTLDAPPTVVGYTLLKELGRGGMGVVYVARQSELNRLVALKVLREAGWADEAARQRFRREAEILAQIRHPNVVQVYDFGRVDGQPYLALELVPDGSLDRRLAGTPLRPTDAARLVETLAHAVQAAHEHGIVHRDLKPANVLLRRKESYSDLQSSQLKDTISDLPDLPDLLDPKLKLADDPSFEIEAFEPKISDFGLAKRIVDGGGLTTTGAVVGSPSYMAPEQAGWNGSEPTTVGPRTDIYALGAILYECLTGRPPFKAATAVETVLQVLHTEPVAPHQLNPKTPRDLETICLKCLRKEPSRRYASASDLAADLRRFLDGKTILARPTSALERSWRWCRRNRVTTLLLLGSALAALAVPIAVTAGLYNAELRASLEETRRAREAEAVAHHATEQMSYYHRVALARQEWRDANLRRARELLDACPQEFRRWEWRYLDGLCRSDARTLPELNSEIHWVVYSPDGQLLAAAGRQGDTQLWDAVTGQPLRTLQALAGKVMSAAFSPDGRRLVTASADGFVRIWEVESGKVLHRFRGHRDPPRMADFTSDGLRVASVDRSGVVLLWEADSGSVIRTWQGIHGQDQSLAPSPDGSKLAHGGGSQVVIWDAVTGDVVQTLIGHKASVRCVRFSPDGKHLLSCSDDGSARIWDPATGKELQQLRGHEHKVYHACYSADGQFIVTAGSDTTVRIWDARDGKELRTLRGHTDRVYGVAFRPDGRFVASGGLDRTVKLWDVRLLREAAALGKHPETCLTVAWRPDGRRLATSDRTGRVSIWDVQAGREELQLKRSEIAWRLAWSPDGTRLVGLRTSDSLAVWDAVTGQELQQFHGHTGLVRCLAWSPNGERIASAGQDGVVRLWDPTTGRETLTLNAHDHNVSGLGWGADGEWLASAGNDLRLRVWNARTGVLVWEAECQPSLRCLACSPDGSRIATGSQDASIRIWDARDGRLLHQIHGHTHSVESLSFHPDGTRLVTAGADRFLRIWDVETGQPALSLNGGAHLLSVAFSPDGQRIAAAGLDGEVRVWDATPPG